MRVSPGNIIVGCDKLSGEITPYLVATIGGDNFMVNCLLINIKNGNYWNKGCPLDIDTNDVDFDALAEDFREYLHIVNVFVDFYNHEENIE